MPSLKELSKKVELFTAGHRMCAGCGAPIIMRLMLLVQETPVVVSCATGCLEVSTTLYPFTSWKCSFIHNAFENSAATISGVEAAYRSLKRQGRITQEIRFIGIGGDGGTYDIGLQSLSGAMERGHRMLYICYNNEAYMNCLSTSSMIMTEAGLKKITEVKPGDKIYAFDQKTYQLTLKECTGVFDNGVKDVYELTTLHHSIKTTSNHPFLIAISDIEYRTSKVAYKTKSKIFVWKLLEHIRIGDEVVAFKNLESGFECEEVISIKYKGKEPTLDLRVEEEHNFIADGIVVHNTGIQRSSATPKGADTTTQPAGKVIQGKQQYPKDITGIMAAHKIPYAAQASPSHWNDLMTKVQKAMAIDGPTFINVISPCPPGWRHDPKYTMELAKIAVETCFWPLYEVENGVKWKITYKPRTIRPITDWISLQGRFSHLLKPENRPLLDEIQEYVNKNWNELLKKEKLLAD